MNKNQELSLLLAKYLAAGKINLQSAQPVFSKLLGTGDTDKLNLKLLYDELIKYNDPDFEILINSILSEIITVANRAHLSLKNYGATEVSKSFPELSFLPADFFTAGFHISSIDKTFSELINLLHSRFFLALNNLETPRLAEQIEQKYFSAINNFKKISERWSLLNIELEYLSEEQYNILEKEKKEQSGKIAEFFNKPVIEFSGFKKLAELNEELAGEYIVTNYQTLQKNNLSGDAGTLQNFAAAVLSLKSDVITEILPVICLTKRLQDYASICLALRFGLKNFLWNQWIHWFEDEQKKRLERKKLYEKLSDTYKEEIIFIQFSETNLLDFSNQQILDGYNSIKSSIKKISLNAFIEIWKDYLNPSEYEYLISSAGYSGDSGQIESSSQILEKEKNIISGSPDNKNPEERILTPTAIDSADADSKKITTKKLDSSSSAFLFPTNDADSKKSSTKKPPPFKNQKDIQKEDLKESRDKNAYSKKAEAWNRHIKPFITEHWYMVAGLVMSIIGASLLAYFTWDKHWLIRYTLTPALLGLLTFGIAELGRRFENSSSEFRSAAALLRAAAVCLLPVNYAVIALLAADPDVSYKFFTVPLMAIIYLIVFGGGVYLWSEAVEKKTGKIFSFVINFLNLIIAAVPVSLLASETASDREMILRISFHIGFVAVAYSIFLFKKKGLAKEILTGGITSSFIGSSILITFIQIFLWSHLLIKIIPKGYGYSLLCVSAGWLVFYVERNYLDLFQERKFLSGFSFFGFAFVIAGTILGFTNPYMRIAGFAAAGIVWFYQSETRPDKINYYISLICILLSFIAIAFLDAFPKTSELNMIPAIGIALVFCLKAFKSAAKNYLLKLRAEIFEVFEEFDGIILFFTTASAILSQWNLKSNQFHTAFFLIIILFLFSIKTYYSQKLRWAHTAMIIAALILPYIGCVNMTDRFIYGNTLAFGLGVLSFVFLIIIKFSRSELLKKSRSTVIFIYGILALVSMMLRVIMERREPAIISNIRIFMDLSGPFVISAALIAASYFSRSLIPSITAAVIISILFPEIKTYSEHKLPFIEWGTGFGTSVSGFVFLCFAFYLRKLKLPDNSEFPDCYYKTSPFPLRRNDYTLFTIPVVLAALYCILKIDTFILISKCSEPVINIKTSIAFAITGINLILCSVYLKKHKISMILSGAATINFFLFYLFMNQRIFPVPQIQYPFLLTGLTVSLILAVFSTAKNQSEYLESSIINPLIFILKNSSFSAAVIIMSGLFAGKFGFDNIDFFSYYLAVQMICHSLRTKKEFNAEAFVCYWFIIELVITYINHKNGVFFNLTETHLYIFPVFFIILLIQIIIFILEFQKKVYAKIAPLFAVFNICSVINLIIASIIICAYILTGTARITLFHQSLIILSLILSARNQGSSILVLITAVIAYLFYHIRELNQVNETGKLLILFNCRNLSVLSLAAGIVSLIIKAAYKKSPSSVSGEYRILKSYSDFIILTVFSLAAAFFAVMIQTLTGEIRYNASYLCVPYISALSVYVLWLINKEINLLLIIANIFFTVANIHTVNIYAGIPYLSNYGLSVIHTICLGIFISIIVFSILSKFNSQFFFNLEIFEKFKTSWSGIILFLLTFNYFSNSNLEDFTLRRFLVSGILAYCSGLIFRNAAFKIRETESALFKTYSFFYNFGVLVALWCLFLMIPHLRSPEVVFIALALPVLYFYLRAELGKHFSINKTQYSQYRDTAMIISFILLFFYVNRAVFQMILFPEQNIFTVHYHYHSPVILAISLILLRLRGLGANYWSSFYGGLGFVTALFFLITFIPGLSPFDRIIPGCWIGAAIYHLFVSLTMYENPVGNLLRKISGLNKIDFTEISIVWSRWIAAAVNILTLLGLSNFQSDSYSAAPLLFAGSSIFLHQNYFDKLNFYKIAAAFQILTALHFDFISPSFIKKNYILWIILTAFASIETVHYFFQKTLKTINFYIFAGLFILAGSHIFYLHPASRSGLSGFFILWILTAFIPVKNQTPVSFRTKIISVFLLIAPVWLTFFSLTTLRSDYNLINGICISPQNFFKCKSQFVFSYLTLFCSAIFVQLCYDKWKSFINKIQNGSNPPFFAVSLKWYSSAGNAISSIFGSVIFAALIITGVFYYNSIFEIKSAAAFSGLWLGLSVFWFLKGGNSENYFPYLSAQLCAACFFAFVRRQLTLTYDFWKIEYDVWASLAVSFIIAGVKQLIYRQKRNMRFSFILTLFVMPVFAVIWTMFHRLGVNMTLLVIGLNSMIFCYYGKDEKDSLYNIAAVIGFVVFCMLLLWTKLEIRYLHSFVIPVSSGILALSQIFKKSLARETLAAVRFTGIASIIGCSGYYALIDSSHTAVFNLAMIAACLLIMFAGSFFKIKLYIMTGFSGLIIDAVSIFYKLIIKFDRTYKMTAMGIALLLIGASLVIGAAYYKTNKIRIDGFIDKIRTSLKNWE